MDTNPVEEVADESSIDDRLAAALEPQAEEPEEPAIQSEEEPDAEEQQPEPENDAEEVEFEGKAYKVPKEIKGALLRQSDYTQKTQELATLRKQAEDRMQFAEAQQQLMAAVHQEATEYAALKKQLENFNNMDWQALYSADPGQAFGLQAQANRLKETLAEKERVLAEKLKTQERIREAHAQKQWQLSVEAAKARIGKLTQEEDIAMAQQAAALGFEEHELKGRFADPRLLHAIYKAAKWDSLQQGKLLASKKVAEARPMKQASRSAPQAQRNGAFAEAREKLRKTGREEYAERLLNQMFKE